MRPRHWRSAAFLLTLLVYAFAFQGSRSLYAPDEGRYSAVALEMVDGGDWLHPHLHPEIPHYTKPPLTYWSLAVAYSVAGRNTWAGRAPNALAYLITVLLVWQLGRRLVPAQPVFPALIYASSMFPYLAANLITTDTLLNLAEALFMLGFVEAWWTDDPGLRRRWGLLAAVAAALAFLTKGPPGLLPVLVAVVFVLWRAGAVGLMRLWSTRAFVVFALLAVSWYLIVAIGNPELLRYFLVDEVWNRVTGSEMHRNPHWYGGFTIYLPTLLLGTLPWTPWMLRSAWLHRSGLHQRLRDDAACHLLLLWVALPLTVFFLARSRLPLYMLPLFVPLALLTARALAPLDLRAPRLRWSIAAWCTLLVLLRLLPVWLDVDNDERKLADAVRQRVGTDVEEIAFVETAPRYGLRLYLGAAVIRLRLPGDFDEPQSLPVHDYLLRDRRCHALLADPKEAAELDAELALLPQHYRDVGLARGYRVLVTEPACTQSP